MSVFTDAEVAYLRSQLLGRLATAGNDQPHAVPTGFRLRPEGFIDIGGRDVAGSKKFRDVRANPRVAFVVDDLASTDPWTPRGIEIRGVAETHESGAAEVGPGFGESFIRIRPRRIVAWGLDTDAFHPNARTVHLTDG